VEAIEKERSGQVNGINMYLAGGSCLPVAKPCAAPISGVAAVDTRIRRDRSWAVAVPRSMALHLAATHAAFAGAPAAEARALERFPVQHRSSWSS